MALAGIGLSLSRQSRSYSSMYFLEEQRSLWQLFSFLSRSHIGACVPSEILSDTPIRLILFLTLDTLYGECLWNFLQRMKSTKFDKRHLSFSENPRFLHVDTWTDGLETVLNLIIQTPVYHENGCVWHATVTNGQYGRFPQIIPRNKKIPSRLSSSKSLFFTHAALSCTPLVSKMAKLIRYKINLLANLSFLCSEQSWDSFKKRRTGLSPTGEAQKDVSRLRR